MSSTPTNAEVAEILTGIADLLEAQGENPYKARAYRKAAQTLESLSEPVADVDARGALDDLPGFGASMVAKTQEILRTGTSALYEQLRAEQAAGEPQPVADSEDALDDALHERDERAGTEEEIPSPW